MRKTMTMAMAMAAISIGAAAHMGAAQSDDNWKSDLDAHRSVWNRTNKPDCGGISPCVHPTWSTAGDWEKLLASFPEWVPAKIVPGLADDLAYESSGGDIETMIKGEEKWGFSNNIAPNLCKHIDRRVACEDDKVGIDYEPGRLKRWLKATEGKLYARRKPKK